MNPSIWGPHAWFFLDAIAFGYPMSPNRRQKEDYREFFELLSDVLPCQMCRRNYRRHLHDFPLSSQALRDRPALVTWVVSVRNMIRAEHGQEPQEVGQVLDFYRLHGISFESSTPESWGPHAWFFLECASLDYPNKPRENQRRAYQRFFQLLERILPGADVRRRQQRRMAKMQLNEDDLKNGQRFFEWVLSLHNAVRIECGKRPRGLEETIDFYREQGFEI
ncbi:MAG: ERV1/ALR-related protein [Sulfobacillus sp.]